MDNKVIDNYRYLLLLLYILNAILCYLLRVIVVIKWLIVFM